MVGATPVDDALESLREHPWFTPLLEFFGYDPSAVDPRVHRADEMFEQALLENGGDVDAAVAAYLSAGAQIARTVETFARAQWAEFDGSWSMLDFGCGYGRVTRFLSAALGSSNAGPHIWASDLLADSLHFQREELGVASFSSHTDPGKVAWPQDSFDFIYVGSLFTHLPRQTFDIWLETLFERVSADGVLLFSVHDLRLKPSGVAVDAEGFAFVESSESREIDHAVYGSTWLGRSALRRAIAELTRRSGSSLHWRRYPRALCGFQDLVAVSRRELECRRLGCVGQVDQALLRGDKYHGSFELRLEGWSIAPGCDESRLAESGAEATSGGDLAPAAPPKVEVRLFAAPRPDPIVVDTSAETDRADLVSVRDELRAPVARSGWALELRLPQRVRRGRDLLVVSSNSSDDERFGSVLYVGTIDRLLLDRAQEHSRRRRDRVYELAETIEQVKQSRFWRLRAAWFRLKRRFGWTDESPTGPDLEPGDRRP